jgi:hypothetical protein
VIVFRLTADATIEALDLDDAFEKLELHFAALRKGEDWSAIHRGTIELVVTPSEKP